MKPLVKPSEEEYHKKVEDIEKRIVEISEKSRLLSTKFTEQVASLSG